MELAAGLRVGQCGREEGRPNYSTAQHMLANVPTADSSQFTRQLPRGRDATAGKGSSYTAKYYTTVQHRAVEYDLTT